MPMPISPGRGGAGKQPQQNNFRQAMNNYIRNSANWMSEMSNDIPIQFAENNFDAFFDQICKKKINDNKAADLNSPIRWYYNKDNNNCVGFYGSDNDFATYNECMAT